jgi:hypothetical protein
MFTVLLAKQDANWLILAIAFTLCFGCGTSDRASVDGVVTVGGAKLESGTITFIPTNGNKGPSAGGTIENGKYRIESDKGPMVGENKVAILGRKKTGRKVPVPGTENLMMDEMVEVVPPRYHSGDALKSTIKPGKNTLDFQLDAK